jgi:tetratricopeptide (TPR) repeat protein
MIKKDSPCMPWIKDNYMGAIKLQENPDFAVMKPEKASLQHLCDSVLNCTVDYSDIAVHIENKAYEEWKGGRVTLAIEQLKRITRFLERPANKNEQATKDLADVYFLIGQLCQYSGLYSESIDWLSKSVFIDDGKSLSYHSIAESYIKTGNIHQAARSFERELSLDEGNYFTYLELAGIYDRDNKPEKAEECLRKLLVRDPDNMQGMHQLIRHYEKNNPSINVNLLIRRLLNIDKKFSWTEAAIRAYYLFKKNKNTDALEFLSSWELNNHPSPVLHCAKAHIYAKLKNARLRKNEIARFRELCKERQDVIAGYIDEFRNIFGNGAAEKLLNFCFPANHSSSPGNSEIGNNIFNVNRDKSL